MSDPGRSPASQLLLALRARKSKARKTAASPASECAGVEPLPLLGSPVQEQPGVTKEEEEDQDSGRADVHTSRSLEEEFDNIKLEKLEDIKVEERDLEDLEVEKETRKEIQAKLLMAREKLSRARNQKEMLRELYETRKKESGNKDWSDWSFEEMRDEYVR